MKGSSPGNKRALRTMLSHVAGTSLLSGRFLLVALTFVIVAHVFFHGVFVLAEELLHFPKWTWVLLPFPLMSAVIWIIVRNWRESAEVRVETNPAAPCRALVLFLSPIDLSTLPECRRGAIEDRSWREEIINSWRMPAEAISHHIPGLERIVVVPSVAISRQGQVYPGSIDHYAGFREFFSSVMSDHISIVHIGELLEDSQLVSVDYEDVKAMSIALERIYRHLEGLGYRGRDIVIDVTSGQTTNSITAAIVALQHDRRFQYVSTRTYAVSSFDVTYHHPSMDTH